MWRCDTCGSNLLDTTAECPICSLPPGTARCLAPRGGDEPRELDPCSKTWIWVAIGTLVPPLGILMLLVWISHKMTPANAPDDDSKLPPVD